ncbi:cytochrome P450 [Streptomyces macrosporus]|uniref:cytochrome P450 n=1 Tax=Streptomyces macrosporus TaxID=44032 RepID=UPI0031D3AF00
MLDVWVVTGFNEVTALLRNPAMSSAWPAHANTTLHDGSISLEGPTRTDDTVRRWFMFNDGDQHMKLRRLVAPLFSAQQLAAFQPHIEDLVTRLLDGKHDRLDIVKDVSVPLSSGVICRLLGMPGEVARSLAEWGQDIAALLYADYLPEVVERGHRALRGLEGVVREALARPELPDDSGLGLLRRARLAGEIDERDILSVASLLVYAGFETTSVFIGKAVRSALHADLWSQLGGPGNASMVEELLRFDTSVRQVARVAMSDVVIGGHRIAEGELVLLMLGAANRDGEVFDEPDHLLEERRIRRHLAFGQGPHYCLGAGLARLEVQIVLRQLVAKWDAVELVTAPVVKRHFGVPVLESLEIRPVRTRASTSR